MVKVVVFGPERRVGIWQGQQIVDANRAYARYLSARGGAADAQQASEQAVPSDLRRFIAAGQAALDGAQQAVEHVGREGGQDVAFAQDAVKLHTPWEVGMRIACAGSNYSKHAAGIQNANGNAVTPEQVRDEARKGTPWGFWKVVDDVQADGDVPYPTRATHFDYEGECVVVMGRRARDVSEADASGVIWGVTLMNDWSIRNDMGVGRPMSFNLPKNFDGSTTLGPCIVVGELDPQNVPVRTVVNGQTRQDYNTEEMTFSFAEYIAFLSRDFTWKPGDFLAGGTGQGTAMDSTRPRPDGTRPMDLYLKVGDVVEVSSPSIGTLRNRVVAKEAYQAADHERTAAAVR